MSSMQYLYALHGRARGLGALDLLINKSTFVVGEAPGYSISGAAINAPVLWSSTKDGLPTGENQSDYGHKTDAVGVWAGPGGNWTVDQAGQWTKTVKVGDETDTVSFQVLPSPADPKPTVQYVTVPGKSLFSGDTIDLFGWQLSKTTVLVGGAIIAYLLFFKKR
jgi:hypothetical protein